MKKLTFYSEISYILGVILLALGTAVTEAADFGVSMVVAPAYLIYRKVSLFVPEFTFGMAEYMLQAVIILITLLVVRKLDWSYIFSFVTAVFYGAVLDASMVAVALIPAETFGMRVVFYIVGLLLCGSGIAMLYQTYIAPEAYELFVKKVSAKYKISLAKFKTAYDITSLLISVVMSFCMFGLWHFEGVKLGTLICTLINGSLIGAFIFLFNRIFNYKDLLPFRKYFEN